jgi:hypothetical protein
MSGGKNYRIINECLYNPDAPNVKLDFHDMETFEYLTGIVDLNMLKSTQINASIIALGDHHVCTFTGYATDLASEQMYIIDYLDLLFRKYPDKQFDILLENDYNKEIVNEDKDFYSTAGFLQNMTKKFYGCFHDSNKENRKLCSEKYPNVRFHSVDIRKWTVSTDKNDALVNLFKSYQNVHMIMFLDSDNGDLSYDPNLNNYDEYKFNIPRIINAKIYKEYVGRFNKYYKFLKNILNPDVNVTVDNIINIADGNYKFRRYRQEAISMIPDENKSDENTWSYYVQVRDYIHKYLHIELQSFELSNIIDFLNKISDHYVETISKNLFETLLQYSRILNNLCLISGSIIMDYYTLLRYYKILHYKNINDAAGKNIILMAGRNHTQIFVNYFYYEKSIAKSNIINNLNNNLDNNLNNDYSNASYEKIIDINSAYFPDIRSMQNNVSKIYNFLVSLDPHFTSFVYYDDNIPLLLRDLRYVMKVILEKLDDMRYIGQFIYSIDRISTEIRTLKNDYNEIKNYNLVIYPGTKFIKIKSLEIENNLS